MVTTRARRAAWAVTAVLLLTSCAASPTTTFLSDTGRAVTVDWADYPGRAGIDTSEALLAPTADAIPAVSAALVGEIEQRLTQEFGLTWQNGPTGQPDEGAFYPESGNGYGGETLLVTFNSGERQSDGIPSSGQDWRRIVAIISGVTADAGLGDFEVDNLKPERAADITERFGSLEPDEQWLWFGTAYGASQWISASLVDVDRDASGEAATDHPDGWNPQSITLSYGATTVRAEDHAAFQKRMAPFAGLDMPAATTSD